MAKLFLTRRSGKSSPTYVYHSDSIDCKDVVRFSCSLALLLLRPVAPSPPFPFPLAPPTPHSSPSSS